jgi:hypothetical protein
VSNIVKRADAGEAVFTERHRGRTVAGIVFTILLLPKSLKAARSLSGSVSPAGYAVKMALMTAASSGDGGGIPRLASATTPDWRSMSSAIMEL